MNLRTARGELVDRRVRSPVVPALYLILQIAALAGIGYLLLAFG